MVVESGSVGVNRASSTMRGLAMSVRTVGAWAVCASRLRVIAGKKGSSAKTSFRDPAGTTLVADSLSQEDR